MSSICESFAAATATANAAATSSSNVSGTINSSSNSNGVCNGTLTVPSRAEAAAFTANIALSSSAPSASSTLRRHRRDTPVLAESRRANSNASNSSSSDSNGSSGGNGKTPSTA